jgi:hypothetical protein
MNRKVPVSEWPQQRPSCENCKTKRFSHRRRGFCVRCYSLIRRIEKLESGQYRVIRGGKRVRLSQSSIAFRVQKAREALKDFRWWEMGITKSTTPLQLEACLIALVRGTRSKVRWINRGIHSYLADAMSAEERQKIYPVLLDIVENLPTAKHRKPYLTWDFHGDSLL